MPRLFALALLAFAGALVSAIPAAAKDGVRATLTTKVPLDAEPGTKVTIAWRLAYLADGRRRLFGAGGVFVRLVSRSGAAVETAFAREDRGRYTATVAVPKGGIGDVEVGIRGWVSGHVERRASDLLFPITNDPVPGVRRIVASPPADQPRSERAEGGDKTWLVALAAGSLLAVGVGFAVVARRAARRAPAVQAGVRPREETVARRSRHSHERCVKHLRVRLWGASRYRLGSGSDPARGASRARP
jgi:hypothetical protein